MAELSFDAESHTYTLDGQRIPSVTQVLEDVGVIDYSRIPADTRERALRRGSAVHLATQYDDEFEFGVSQQPLDESTVLPEWLGYLEAWRRFRAESRFRPDLIEYRSYHRLYRYAGTLDRSGSFDGQNFRVLLDIKTGTAQPWVALQLAAYSAFFDAPRSFLRVSVELHSDETYRVETFSGGQWQQQLNEFLGCLSTYRVRRQYGNVGS